MRYACLPFTALLATCALNLEQTELEARVSSATAAAWVSLRLPDPPERCQVFLFEAEFPDTQGFNRLCAPHTTATAFGCFRWRTVEQRFQGLRETISRPVAVISPDLPAGANVEGLLIHELVHGLVHCALQPEPRDPYHPDYDPYDADHDDPRIWGGSTPGTVEHLARELLANLQ
jgi:hypothetical protein